MRGRDEVSGVWKGAGGDAMKDWILMTLIGVILALVVIVIMGQPYFEASAFNKFTSGPKATYWDALWTELRVTPR